MLRRILRICVVIVIFLATSPAVSLAQLHPGQVNAVEVDAKAAGEADANQDVNKPLYFAMGCLIPFAASWVVEGLGTSSALLVPPAVILGSYSYQPNPPPSRLIGKPAEYVYAYTQRYKSKRAKIQAQWVSAGCIISGVVNGLRVLGVLRGWTVLRFQGN